MTKESIQVSSIDFLEPDELYSPSELVSAGQNVSLYERHIIGGFKPKNADSAQAIVRWANTSGAKLYPFSKGNNWAFGSKLPAQNNNYILDLSRLNTISEYNTEFGFIRIGPGVTQGQVSDFLNAQKSEFFLDVTGSGRETSVIGNALERGIAYNSLRSDHLLNLEVVLGNGERISTGFHNRVNGSIADVYSWGLGPNLDQIFFQSNFGIILSATYQLLPKPPARNTLQIQFKEEDLPKVVEKIRKLLRQGTLDCIVHLADPYRSVSTLIPLLHEEDREHHYKMLMRDKRWSGIASVYGTESVTRAKEREINRELRPLCQVRSYNEQKIGVVKKLAAFFGFRRFARFIDATQGLRGLVRGQATDDALLMVNFNPRDVHSMREFKPANTLDQAQRGLLFCVPVAGFSSENCKKMVKITRTFETKYTQISFGMTLNTLNEKVIEAVISLHFEKAAKEMAHGAFVELYQELIRNGFPPYRLNPEIMDLLPIKDARYAQFIHELKLSCDPKEVLAPGRYSF